MPSFLNNLQVIGTITVGVDDTGHDVKFFGATAGSFMLWDESANALLLTDSTPLNIGDGSDLQIKHNGSDTLFNNNTGDIYLTNKADNKDIIFQSDDSSGGVVTYFFLDGSAANGTNTFTTWGDQSVIALGASNDLKLWHNGTNSYIKNEVGSFNIVQAVDDGDLVLKCDNGSGGTTAYLTLDGSASTIEVVKNTNFAGNIDVDGIANLDAVDIDGNVDMAGTLLVAGLATTNLGLVIKMAAAPTPAEGHAILYMDSNDGAVKIAVTYGEATTRCQICPTPEG